VQSGHFCQRADNIVLEFRRFDEDSGLLEQGFNFKRVYLIFYEDCDNIVEVLRSSFPEGDFMVVLIILGVVSLIIGLIGCIIPGIAGPPFSFLALILLSIAKKWEPFGVEFLILMAVLTAIVTALDYIVPAVGAKKFGASKAGFWGAVLGLFVGLIWFPPFGMILGAFLGAFVGELAVGKQGHEALKAGVGVFIGVMFGMVLKLILSGIMTFYFIRALF
jgi:uncharacterized protein YqgC (DUF456 family)